MPGGKASANYRMGVVANDGWPAHRCEGENHEKEYPAPHPRHVMAVLAARAGCRRPVAAADETARNLLPDEIRQKGILIAGLPLDFEPFNYLDDKNEQVGLDVEMFRAIADVLGLKPEIQRLGFASIIPAVTRRSRRCRDVAMGILEPRLKHVSFVRYGHCATA